ncbi:MAG: ribosome hibernation-promoting factor, HPF/YfiA family [Candidatus Saccharimonadales bacterium]
MINRLEITGVHFAVDDDIRSYTTQKIGKLDKYVSRHTRENLHAEVKLKAGKAKNKQAFTCEVILGLTGENFVLKESGRTMPEAIDLAEEKLKIHLKKYKDTHTNHKLHQRIIAKL